MGESAYARAGVDYSKMEPFKMAMIETGRRTLSFPNKRNVYINEDALHAHGAVFEYRGTEPHIWAKTQEGLGNKNWIAEWMYKYAEDGNTRHENIGIDVMLMSVNDLIAQGAMPVVCTDQVDVGSSEWFSDEKRSKDFAHGIYRVCEESGMALAAGETATLKYLLQPSPPVLIAPTFSCSVTGIIAPKKRLVTGSKLAAGDCVIGATSSGIHSNGITLVINYALELPDKFLTTLPNGNTLGDEALIPTRSYVALIETLLENDVEVHALLPGTGDGVGKIAFDKRPFTYRIRDWPEVPELFRYFHEELNLPIMDCLKTFNWGVGYYVYAPQSEAERIVSLGQKAGYDMKILGIVEEGERQVIFEPSDVILGPPGE